MKAIILAAGKGTRMKELAKDKPKCMLEFLGTTLLKRQLDLFNSVGLIDPIVVTGYMQEKIQYANCLKVENKEYDSTNMLESLFCTRKYWDDPIIVSYGDIVYEERVLRQLLDSEEDISVVVDLNGADYFKKRFGDEFLAETESLVMDTDNCIKDVGAKSPHIAQVEGQYMGLMKFTQKGVKTLCEVYDRDKKLYWNKPWLRSKNFRNGYMTDMLQRLIDLNNKVYAVCVKGGWLEFDSEKDYYNYLDWKDKKQLDRYFLVSE